MEKRIINEHLMDRYTFPTMSVKSAGKFSYTTRLLSVKEHTFLVSTGMM